MKHYNISFNHENHTYSNEQGMELSGVTSILKRYLFADLYSGIPDAIMEQARVRGTKVHSDIQMYIEGFPMAEPSIEMQNFISWSDGKLLNSEVLVTNNTSIASMIDIVEEKEDSFDIYDIKTTSTLNIEYLRWQLSIYSYLLRTYHEVTKPINLFAIHLREEVFSVTPIKPIEDEHIHSLISAFENNEECFTNPLYIVSSLEEEMLSKIEEVEFAVIEIENFAKLYKEKQAKLREGLIVLMKERGITKWESDKLLFSLKGEYDRVSIDSTKLKKEMPEVYDKYSKVSKVKESLTIKVK